MMKECAALWGEVHVEVKSVKITDGPRPLLEIEMSKKRTLV